ncbi:MAG: hypothetical protein CL760_11855 [Chloroflexi bacterium]|nr:hypothetical protein [Chloroflexota bacterium]|tara:strand:+ start:60648 stop:61736 length:1089 start_codon:yes stop_codon:yes gene_type:complete
MQTIGKKNSVQLSELSHKAYESLKEKQITGIDHNFVNVNNILRKIQHEYNYTYICIDETKVSFERFNNIKVKLFSNGFVSYRVNAKPASFDSEELFDFEQISPNIRKSNYGKKHSMIMFLKRNNRIEDRTFSTIEELIRKHIKVKHTQGLEDIYIDEACTFTANNFIQLNCLSKLEAKNHYDLINHDNVLYILDCVENKNNIFIGEHYFHYEELKHRVEQYFEHISNERISVCSIRENDFELDTLKKLYSNLNKLGYSYYRFKEEKANTYRKVIEQFEELPSEIYSVEKHNFGVLFFEGIEHLTSDKKMELIEMMAMEDETLKMDLLSNHFAFKMKGHFIFTHRTRKEYAALRQHRPEEFSK